MCCQVKPPLVDLVTENQLPVMLQGLVLTLIRCFCCSGDRTPMLALKNFIIFLVAKMLKHSGEARHEFMYKFSHK